MYISIPIPSALCDSNQVEDRRFLGFLKVNHEIKQAIEGYSRTGSCS